MKIEKMVLIEIDVAKGHTDHCGSGCAFLGPLAVEVVMPGERVCRLYNLPLGTSVKRVSECVHDFGV